MKGNKKILVIAVLLLLIAVSYTTYAIYKTSSAGNASVTAAKWNVSFKNGSDTITSSQNIVFSGADCTNNHVAEGKIAPGATCTKTITIDVADTEVDVTYSATHGDVLVGGSAADEDANDFTVTLTDNGTGTITHDATQRTATLTLTVAWNGTDDSNANPADVINEADTGMQGQTITVPVTLVAKQVPVTTAP